MLPNQSFSSIRKTLIAVFLLITQLNIVAYGQNKVPDDAKCYLVVGAFNLERNASLFQNMLSQKGITATYRKNTHRNLYYIYTTGSRDREEIKNKLFKFRENHPEYNESWLYAGNFRCAHIPSDQWVFGNAENTASAEQNTSTQQSRSFNSEKQEVKENESIENNNEELQPEVVNKKAEEKVAAPPLKKGTYRIYINAYDGASLKEISGEFMLEDAERNKEIERLTSHQAVVIDKPSNATNKITVKSDIFDYKPIEHTFDLDEPLVDSNGIIEMTGDTILVNFPLRKHEKGDIMVMWKVYFYKDAAIMKEGSIGQLNQLLRMMQSNPEMRILIHGHTNGNSHGKVLHLSDGDLGFFNLKSAEHNEINASAKKLSEFRAYSIQHWLEDQGISEDRIEIKGWGGKKMLYDKHDTQAHKNVRVEIEVIDQT